MSKKGTKNPICTYTYILLQNGIVFKKIKVNKWAKKWLQIIIMLYCFM